MILDSGKAFIVHVSFDSDLRTRARTERRRNGIRPIVSSKRTLRTFAPTAKDYNLYIIYQVFASPPARSADGKSQLPSTLSGITKLISRFGDSHGF
jgi:hypothetical protein